MLSTKKLKYLNINNIIKLNKILYFKKDKDNLYFCFIQAMDLFTK